MISTKCALSLKCQPRQRVTVIIFYNSIIISCFSKAKHTYHVLQHFINNMRRKADTKGKLGPDSPCFRGCAFTNPDVVQLDVLGPGDFKELRPSELERPNPWL